jgi:hypothetical protein
MKPEKLIPTLIRIPPIEIFFQIIKEILSSLPAAFSALQPGIVGRG